MTGICTVDRVARARGGPGARGTSGRVQQSTAGMRATALAVLAISVSSRWAAAQQDGNAGKNVEERINQLDQEIRVLKRLRELDKDSATAKAKATPTTSAGPQGFGWRSA